MDKYNDVIMVEMDKQIEQLEARIETLEHQNSIRFLALKAVEVSLIEDKYYQHFKPLLKTVKEAIEVK